MPLLKHPIARDMISLLPHVLPDTPQQLSIADAHALQQADEVVRGVSAIGTAVVLAAGGQGFGEQFLAAVGRVASPASVAVAAYVAVDVADVVEVFGFEFLWSGERGWLVKGAGWWRGSKGGPYRL